MLRLAAALAVSAGLLVAASAPACAEFGTPFQVSAAIPHPDLFPQVAIGANGSAAFVWRGAGGRIQARARSAAGVLGPIRSPSEAAVSAEEPQLAVDAGGDAVAIWRLPIGADDRVQARRLSAGSALGSTQTLSPAGVSGEHLHIAAEPNGDAVIVWRRVAAGGSRIQARTRSAAGALGPILTLSSGGGPVYLPRVAVDAEGDAVIAWVRFDGMRDHIQARTLSAAGALGSILTLSQADRDAFWPRVAIDADGDALITWHLTEGPYSRIQARALSKAGVLGPLQMISPAERETDFAELAMQADGDALIVWQDDTGSTWRIQARTRSKAGVLGPIETLSKAGQIVQLPQVAGDSDGDAVFVWSYFDGGANRVQARFRSKAGVLGLLRTLTPAGQDARDPRVAMDPDGDAVATWHRHESAGGYRLMGAATP